MKKLLILFVCIFTFGAMAFGGCTKGDYSDDRNNGGYDNVENDDNWTSNY